MIYLSDPTIVIIDWGLESKNPVNPADIVARYRLLEDHQINDQFYFAGTIVRAGIEAPANWIPSPNVEPLNALAVTAFYAQGPRDLGLVRTQWQPFFVTPPITYWKQTSPNVWILTGLGSALAPVFGDPGHPIGGYPQ